MRRSRWTVAVALAVAWFLAPVPSVAKEGKFFVAHIQYYQADIQTEGRTDGDQEGTLFDLEDTLGVDTKDGLPAADLWFHILRRNSIRVSYLTGNYGGSRTLTRPLIYGDETYPPGTAVDSQFDFALAQLHYNFRFLDIKWLDVGFLLGVDAFDVDGEVASRNPGFSDETENFTAPFPVAGVNLTVKVPKSGLHIYGEATGTNVSVSDVDANALDLQARLTWYILNGPFGLSAGYRYLDLDLDVEDEGEGDYQQESFYGGIAVRF